MMRVDWRQIVAPGAIRDFRLDLRPCRCVLGAKKVEDRLLSKSYVLLRS
jgi:hypothetical protein